MEPGVDNLFRLNDLRLARLLETAADSHLQCNYDQSIQFLSEAEQLVGHQERKLKGFLLAWQKAIQRESGGLPLSAPPAAWPKIAGEILERRERNQKFEEFMDELLEERKPPAYWARRFGVALMGVISFVCGFTAVVFVLRGVISHFDQSYRIIQLPFFRQGVWMYVHAFATFVWGSTMAIYGFHWIARACQSQAFLRPKISITPVSATDQNPGQ